MRQNEDSLLISQISEGSKMAFEELYYRYSAKLYNSVSLILYDKNLAKDITQSAFLTVWEKRETLDADKNFQSYLFTIARHLVYKETERLILKNKFVELALREADEFEDKTVESLNSHYLEDYINQLVGDLPQTQKEIFLLKKEENLSNKEIASQLHLTERAVEAHFYRTMKYMKEKLRDFMMIFLC